MIQIQEVNLGNLNIQKILGYLLILFFIERLLSPTFAIIEFISIKTDILLKRPAGILKLTTTDIAWLAFWIVLYLGAIFLISKYLTLNNIWKKITIVYGLAFVAITVFTVAVKFIQIH